LEDNIKMDLQEVGGGRWDWMELAQDTPYTSSYTCCSYQEDKSAKLGILPKCNSLLEIGEHWIKKKTLTF
jgi:hypothetical protein